VSGRGGGVFERRVAGIEGGLFLTAGAAAWGVCPYGADFAPVGDDHLPAGASDEEGFEVDGIDLEEVFRFPFAEGFEIFADDAGVAEDGLCRCGAVEADEAAVSGLNRDGAVGDGLEASGDRQTAGGAGERQREEEKE